ncbi:homoserine dehydrogenase [Apiospora arundinis]
MELIQNMSWTEPFAFCSSIADLNGPDLPEISNEQACATTTQYTAPFIPLAAPNNHYALPEYVPTSRPEPVPAVGSSRHSRQRAHPKRTPVSALSSNDPSSTSNKRRLCSAPQERVLQVENAPGKRGMGHIKTAPSNKIAPNRKPVFEQLLCVQM